MLKKIIFLGGAIVLATLLSACGQKGPLYLPDATPAHQTGAHHGSL
jgi:predicted small lipoprotein YifL